MKVTREQIEAAKSAKGGWTKSTLARWGVPWPPPKGWRRALENGEPISGKRDANYWTTAQGQFELKMRRQQADWSRLDTWE